jgi:diacylglycerol kinase family enzyme
MADNILYLLNPNSDEGRARGKWNKLVKRYSSIPKNPIEVGVNSNFEKIITEYKPRTIAIGGGDGTINAVCESLLKFKDKPLIAILPFGYGNALAHCLGVESLEKAAYVLMEKPNTVTIDLLKTNLPQKEIGVFNISVGFEARIVHFRDNFRYIGLRSYALSAVRGFFLHAEKEMRFTIDHMVSLNATASSLAIANCPIIGQNYVVAQSAKLNDGYLDCTVFSSKYAYLTNLRLKGFKHPFYSELGKVHFKAKHVRIEGEPFVQIDGDPALSTQGLEVELLPKQLTFLRNKKENIDILYLPFT